MDYWLWDFQDLSDISDNSSGLFPDRTSLPASPVPGSHMCLSRLMSARRWLEVPGFPKGEQMACGKMVDSFWRCLSEVPLV